jgi:hypothetical protein
MALIAAVSEIARRFTSMSPRPFQYFSTILDGTSASVVVVVVVVVVVLEYMATAVLERAEREALKTARRRSAALPVANALQGQITVDLI